MESRDKAHKAGKSNRLYFVVVAVMLVILIILGSVVVHRVYDLDTTQSSPSSSRAFNISSVFERFPGYFRTKQQQAIFEQHSTASFVATACCNSGFEYTSPSSADDVMGINRIIAQFDTHRQYFYQETCSQIANCAQCTCFISKHVVSAVYVVAEYSYDVGAFDLSTCCKCING